MTSQSSQKAWLAELPAAVGGALRSIQIASARVPAQAAIGLIWLIQCWRTEATGISPSMR